MIEIAHAALYLRLSKDDGISDESNSITSQRMLLTQFAEKNGFQITAEFLDDGISGTKWERPGLQDLLSAAEDGWIDTVIIKDLSRLSRDYIRTGELLERWFPAHGIRLISVADCIDTQYTNSDKYLSLRAVIDDWYARDISYKVRAALYARQAERICTSSRLPYGYKKTTAGIAVQEEKASVVRQIYKLFGNGISCSGIAERLTSENTINPSESGCTWNDNSVRRILENPVYTGSLHIHTTERISYKCNKRKSTPVTSHIILPVPAIIDTETYQKANKLLHMRRHHRDAKHWLSGLIICGICHAPMILQKESSGFRAICSGRRRKNGCTNRSCSSGVLSAAIAEALQNEGFPASERLSRLLIRQIVLNNDSVTLRFKYQKPSETERNTLLMLLKPSMHEITEVGYV